MTFARPSSHEEITSQHKPLEKDLANGSYEREAHPKITDSVQLGTKREELSNLSTNP